MRSYLKGIVLGVAWGLAALAIARCSETAQGETKEPAKANTFTCEIEMSEVKWFWGEVCPIGKEKWVSVGHSYAQNNNTTGCVQLKNVCSMTQ